MLNNLIVVTVTPFSGSISPDKNNRESVMLQCIAGRMPNRNVLSGTVAERAGFEVGRTYLAQVRESGYDKVFGPDFTFIKVRELMTGADIAATVSSIGEPDVFTVARPEGFEEAYHRKSTVVEGIKAQRVKQGEYIPANQGTNYNHPTADKKVKGSSIDPDNDMHQLTEDDLTKK